MRMRWSSASLTTVTVAMVFSAFATAAQTGRGPVGDWALAVEWPGRKADVTLAVTEEDNGLRAIWKGPQGVLTPGDVTFRDGVLRFTLDVEDQNVRAVRLRFEGRVEGDEIDGALLTPQGAQIKVKGRRRPSGDALSRLPRQP